MGPGIIIPVLLIAVVIPVAFTWAKKNLKDAANGSVDEPVVAPGARLTSNALREFASPPWRVAYEIPADKLDGLEHVLIGPAGVFALKTLMDPIPEPSDDEPDAHDVALAAVARSGLDDALARCAMSSSSLVEVHWGVREDGSDPAIDRFAGLIAVDGRRLEEWAGSLPTDALTPAQVDLAWQTVLTAIGRPDPLA